MSKIRGISSTGGVPEPIEPHQMAAPRLDIASQKPEIGEPLSKLPHGGNAIPKGKSAEAALDQLSILATAPENVPRELSQALRDEILKKLS